MDFGISKKTYYRAARRDIFTFIGTHFYLAPEVYNGGDYDQRIDVWALGVTVYKLILGYAPFESEYHSDKIANMLKGEFIFHDKIQQKISPFAQYFIIELLRNQEQRNTLAQAAKHLWFQPQDIHQSKLRKMRSFNISLCEDFHRQFHKNIKNASSKKQGTFLPTQQNQENTDEGLKLNKTIDMMSVKQYELQDSDDEDSVITPRNRVTKSNFLEQKAHFSFALQKTNTL